MAFRLCFAQLFNLAISLRIASNIVLLVPRVALVLFAIISAEHTLNQAEQRDGAGWCCTGRPK